MSGDGYDDRRRAQVTARLRPAFLELLDAYEYSEDANCSPWDFAVSMRRLGELGLRETDLRWFVHKGYVEHAWEVTLPGDQDRVFRASRDFSCRRRVCFVLTESGVSKARSLAADDDVWVDPPHSDCIGARGVHEMTIPCWDAERRELRMGKRLVKRFKWQAVNQEILLSAFQEEDWPSRIDDPLPPQSEQDSKRRLSDTIKCLNRKQANELIHFRGDGTGEGIIWEPANKHDQVAGGNQAR